jgi:hypothetical protein
MLSRTIRTRAILVVALVTALGAAQASAYVLPVTDVFNWIRNQAIALQTEWQNEVLRQNFVIVRKMARRLSEYVGDLRARFGVHDDDPPRWRTHDFESDRYLYGRVYGAALNYGDASGQAVATITRPAPTMADLPSTMTPDARLDISRAFATLDVADALLREDTNQSGLLRYGGRSLYAAANTFELDALDGDVAQSTDAVLDKLNAAAILELKQKQGRNDLLLVAVELALLDTKRHRDTEAIAMNQRLRAKQYYRAYSATFFRPESADIAAAWRQP